MNETLTGPTHGHDSDVARLRVPPHSNEAEQSVLGGLLQENQAWDRAADLLTAADFYSHAHRLIYAAIGSLVTASKPADVITVFEHLKGLGQADDAGGLGHLNALAQSVPSAANTRRYAEIVRERSVLRQLMAVSDEIGTDACNPRGRAVADLVQAAESKILCIGDIGRRQRGEFQDIDKLMVAMLDDVQALADAAGDGVPGVRTGFYDLDRMTAGLQKGDLILLAARPSMGKTALALNIAENVAVKAGLPVLVFSMEMTAAQLAKRLAGSLGRVNQQSLRTGRLTHEEWERLPEAVERLQIARLSIDETPGLTSTELRSRARRKARQLGPLGLIVIDYLQLMSGQGGGDNRATELGEISRGLKSLAKELQCPVLALSQLNRSVETRNDKRPLMSDLRESGALEQDADVVAFIYRDDYYTKSACTEPGVAELILSKQRNGPVGTVKLAFQAELARFENLAPGA